MRVRAVQKLNVLKLRIQTHNLGKKVAADPCLSPRGHWDQPFWHLRHKIQFVTQFYSATVRHLENVCSSAVYKVRIAHTKDRLGVGIYNA